MTTSDQVKNLISVSTKPAAAHNDAAAFEIADHGAVALPPLPGEVVNADNGWR
jgi:hypothetical protein